MAFHASGLPSIAAAAATSGILPSIAIPSAFPIPWRASSSVSPCRPRTTTTTQPITASTATRENRLSLPAQGDAIAAAQPKKLNRLPDFFRDAPLHQLGLGRPSLANVSPTNILSDLSAMSPRAIAMANPLISRSFATLMGRRPSAAVPAFRFMSTHRLDHARPAQSFTLQHLSRNTQSRTFGTGGVPHAILANREAAANRNPSSATAQASFYQLLLKANMPAIVVERYSSGRFATNEAATEAYHKALAMINGATGGAASTSHELDNGTLNAVGQAVAARHAGGNVAISSQGAGFGAGAGGKSGPLHVIVDETFGSTAFRWFKFLLWFGLSAYLSLVVITMVLEGMTTLKRPGGKMDNSEAKSENQKARFADVHGCDEAKEELQELVDFLRNPDKFNGLGGKLPKGVLLVGPPGTGKTLLARAVAGEAGVPFFFMSGSEFDEIYVGVGAKRVRELFQSAKAKSPSIIFIDELDAIGGKRNSRDATYVRQTLNQLLTEMDGFSQNSGVIVMAATNFPESLDKALTRPGRFDRHVQVDLPDVRGRIAILKHHAKKVKMAAEVNMEAIASRTSGLSGAELENIVNQAAIHASKLKASAVAQAHLEWAKDKVIMGAEKRSMVINPKEKEMTAYHEAGHALVAFFAPDPSQPLYKVTILPRGQTLGHTAYIPEMDKYSYSVRDYVAMIDRAMGGKVAEEIVYGHDLVTSGVSSDLEHATRLAWQMVARLGMSQSLGPVDYLANYKDLSSETRAQVESGVKKVLDDSYARARKLLVEKRTELDLLAKALVEYETLDRDEVEKVVRGEKLPNRISVPPGPMTVPKPHLPLDGGLLGPYPAGDGPGNGPSGPPPPAPPPPAPKNRDGEN
ncbi:mitochondrial inner membrane i-AAA protease supercomplex subunit YME1 [Podospora australis]|uniref:Mitochondrial inner membrane i-AAA protease supercomplex subunit YME1 n=1 Tax=Podospora australis TaxID=1536484 RepID=A0AAN7AJU2_9PEZI|nr:mitochondrial inner membrane i-AAA protease supercomplex subunit YME1 [Podospora australis]